MKTLILYSTHDGQTQKIAQFIAQRLADEVHIASISDTFNLDYECVIIGASVRYGHFDKKLYLWIQQHKDWLASKITAFYGVNLTARKVGKDCVETNVYVRKFLQRIDWKPHLAAVFAGALCYPRYNFFDRNMIKFIMKLTGGETDISKEVEYTDWQKVTDFAEQINELIKQHTPI